MTVPHRVVLCDSLEKVYGVDDPRPHALGEVVMPRNGTASFQVAISPRTGWSPGHIGGAVPTISAPAGVEVTAHAVDFIPCPLTASTRRDERYDHTGPALLPDVLRPLAPGDALELAQLQWRALWFTVRSTDAALDGDIRISLSAEHTGESIGEVSIGVNVVDVDLGESPIICAQWFHVDGLAQHYGVEPYSVAGWEIIERFAAAAVDSGSTSMLTPIHTPPLDTAEGTQRLDVALVGVEKTEDGWSFDMTRLVTWLKMCRRVGVRELEMAHLFTQWGGTSAPAIHDRQGKLLFGWHTDSLSPEYLDFLAAYLPAVQACVAEHWDGDVFWHLTDEPRGEHAERYAQLKEAVSALLGDATVTDALSDLQLWATGLVDPPIVSTDHAQPFVDAGLTDPWLYYCTSQSEGVANRFIAMPSYRNRVLGQQLFRYGASGFLHWGFNFWNTQLSRRPLNPFTDPSSGHGFQAGDAFIVYPGTGGIPWASLRLRVFREALDDLRIFTALAERDGRESVISLLGIEDLTLVDYTDDPAHYLRGHAAALRALAGSSQG